MTLILKRFYLGLSLMMISSFYISCNQTAHIKPYQKTITFKTKYVDTSMIAIIPFKGLGKIIFDSNYKAASLTKNDIVEIDSLFTACLTNYNNTLSTDNNNFRISSGDYRQYIAAINNKGEKEVWINCFCNIDNNDWKNSIVMVSDGGSCYYRFKINLTKKTYYDLSVNGIG